VFGVTTTILKKKRMSPTSDKFMEIVEGMVVRSYTYQYNTICDMIWGKTSDTYQRFYQRNVVASLFNRLRHNYLLHIYQIGEAVTVLRTKEQFNEIISDHEKRIDGYHKVIRQLEKDKANINSGRYGKELGERLEALRTNKKVGVE